MPFTALPDPVTLSATMRDLESSIVARRGPRHDKAQQDRYDALASAGTPVIGADWHDRPTAQATESLHHVRRQTSAITRCYRGYTPTHNYVQM